MLQLGAGILAAVIGIVATLAATIVNLLAG
jgi:hypothetical protein